MGDLAFLITSPHHLTLSPFSPNMIKIFLVFPDIFITLLYFVKYSKKGKDIYVTHIQRRSEKECLL